MNAPFGDNRPCSAWHACKCGHDDSPRTGIARLFRGIGVNGVSVEQACKPDSVRRACARRAIIRLGRTLLAGSGLLPACAERVTLCARGRVHAYLKLLRIEVAAFHPGAPPTCVVRNTEVAVSVRDQRRARAPDSSLWPCSSACWRASLPDGC